MNQALVVFDGFLQVLRVAVFWTAVAIGVVALLDWLVRTRRVSPFSPLARFARDTVDPLLRPVERAVVRAGGTPAATPWWALVFVVIAGLIVLSLLGFIRDQLAYASFAVAGGAGGLGLLAVRWTFQVLRLALIVRVASTWFGISPYGRWVRWSYTLSEPLLGPLRRVVPTLGMVDITPIVAFLALNLLEAVVANALA